LSTEQKLRLLDEVLTKQNADGGWSAASLGNWNRADGKPQSTASDGYGTALVVASFKRFAKDDQRKALDRGRAWLRTHQNSDGSWRAESLNKEHGKNSEIAHFLTDAATGWAVLALSE
jgi:hypothetical protein